MLEILIILPPLTISGNARLVTLKVKFKLISKLCLKFLKLYPSKVAPALFINPKILFMFFFNRFKNNLQFFVIVKIFKNYIW